MEAPFMRNDMKWIEMAQMLKHAYRGRLRHAYVVGAPSAFNGLWRVVKGWAHRIHVVCEPFRLLPKRTQDSSELDFVFADGRAPAAQAPRRNRA